MLTVSEVANPEKLACRALVICIGLFFFAPAFGDSRSAEKLGERLGDCNWQVTYRDRTYDLSPLTREALSRPIENDIRYAIQRVPEANERLEQMTYFQRSARAHTLIASAFLGAFVLFKVLESSQNNRDQRDDYRVASFAAGGFFLGATIFSWISTRAAKTELVNAVDEFNEHSPAKILPASGEPNPLGGTEN